MNFKIVSYNWYMYHQTIHSLYNCVYRHAFTVDIQDPIIWLHTCCHSFIAMVCENFVIIHIAM